MPPAHSTRAHPKCTLRRHPASSSIHLLSALHQAHHHRKKKKKAFPTLASIPEPYLPPHKLSLSSEERAAPPPTVLARAGEEVAAYCARLPAGSPEADACEVALDYFKATTSAAGAACGIDPAVAGSRSGGGGGSVATTTPPPNCDDLDRFEAFVKTLLYAGGVPSFVAALSQRRESEARDASGGLASPSTPTPARPPAAVDSPDVARRRAALVSLFHAYDTSGRGRLDAAQFRAAAADAAGGRALDGRAVSTIFETLDVHGAGVSLDDFLAAVEADELASHTPLAAWLRRHPAGEDLSAGWQHLPGSLDMLL